MAFSYIEAISTKKGYIGHFVVEHEDGKRFLYRLCNGDPRKKISILEEDAKRYFASSGIYYSGVSIVY